MLKQFSLLLLVSASLIVSSCCKHREPKGDSAVEKSQPTAVAPVVKAQDKYAWRSMFDGKSLGKWKASDFAGAGEVKIKDGAIYMPHGNGDMTGVTWTGEYPKVNYEIELEAQRVQGSDFFCGLTFPLNNTCASLICGGWGGSVCGISCLDFQDAANNETMSSHQFKTGQWYRIRMRVTNEKFQSWIDDERIVNVSHKGRKVDVRIEVTESKPLGIATWCTDGAARSIKIRELRPEEVEETNAKDPNAIE